MGGWIGESVVGELGGCEFCWRTTIGLGERAAVAGLVGREGAVSVAVQEAPLVQLRLVYGLDTLPPPYFFLPCLRMRNSIRLRCVCVNVRSEPARYLSL